MDYEDDDDFDSGPDRTERKGTRRRQAAAMRDLGDELVALSAERLAEIPLDEELLEAVRLAQRISARGGRRRQLQLIGKLLRQRDAEPILAAMESLEQKGAQSIAAHHQAERWRDRLLSEEDAVTAFLAEHPAVDRQRLRQLIRAAQQEQAADKPPRAFRELFRLVRDGLG